MASASCKKYDQDGQLIHFRTPENRLKGEWELKNFISLDCPTCVDTLISAIYSSNNLQMDFDFDKDGAINAINTTDDIELEGEWEFNSDKSILTMTFDNYKTPDTTLTNANVVIYWKILELELDDFQAYQFREYDGQDINQYAYYLRLEKR